MKHLLLALSLALAAGACNARATHAAAASQATTTTAAAADPAATPAAPQRNKMKACNAQAKTKDIHGPDRRAFMKQCLSSGKAKSDAS